MSPENSTFFDDSWTREPSGVDRLVFLEDREDLVVSRSLGGELEARRTLVRGAGIAEAARYRFVADPRPPAAPRNELTPGIEAVESALAGALREAGAEGVLLARATWIGVDQWVRVTRPGEEPREDRRRGARIRVEARLSDGSGVGVAESASRPGRALDPADAGHIAARRAKERRRTSRLRSGALPAIFAPGVAGVLVHELVGHALEADTIARGASLLARASGAVAPAHVRVLDDPRRGRVPFRIDDDGEPTRPVPLLEDGKVAGTISMRGHARRATYAEPTLPRMGCTFLGAGSMRPDQVIADVREGVFLRRLEAASTDPSTGIATFRVTDADRIVDGAIAEPLDPFLATIGVLRALATIEAIADDLEFDTCLGTCLKHGQPMITSVGAPTCRLRLIKVHG